MEYYYYYLFIKQYFDIINGNTDPYNPQDVKDINTIEKTMKFKDIERHFSGDSETNISNSVRQRARHVPIQL